MTGEKSNDIVEESKYVDELAEQIGDSGGCCEAWAAAEELRDSQNEFQLNATDKRRGFLKKRIGGYWVERACFNWIFRSSRC